MTRCLRNNLFLAQTCHISAEDQLYFQATMVYATSQPGTLTVVTRTATCSKSSNDVGIDLKLDATFFLYTS